MRLLLIGIAVVLFGVAIYFGNQQPFGGNSPNMTPNWVAALSSFGFALAGGLSLIAAALAKETDWAGRATPPAR
jgi:hypothetical protein